MDEDEILQYVQSAARLLDLPLDPARAQAVALHFGRTAAIAKALQGVSLAPDAEPAALYQPAPFPAEDPQ